MFEPRKARAEDLSEIVTFYETVAEQCKGSSKTPQCLLEPVEPAFLAHSIAHGELYLGYWNDRLVASVVLNREQHAEFSQVHWTVPGDESQIGVLHTMAVLPRLYGRGLGKLILDYVTEEARKQGLRALRYDVLKSDLMLQHYAIRAGFQFRTTVMRSLSGRRKYPYGMYELEL